MEKYEFEKIEGMTNRTFKSEDNEQLILAIKGGTDSGFQNLQNYWKERCGNPEFQPMGFFYPILYELAIDEFDRGDWFNLFRDIPKYGVYPYIDIEVYKDDETVNIMVKQFISAIGIMTMRYKNKGETK